MTDYLDGLDLLPGEREKLRLLGAKTPLALLLMRKASPDAFDAHLGAGRATGIAGQLHALLSVDEKARFNEPPRPQGSLGACLPDPGSEPTNS